MDVVDDPKQRSIGVSSGNCGGFGYLRIANNLVLRILCLRFDQNFGVVGSQINAPHVYRFFKLELIVIFLYFNHVFLQTMKGGLRSYLVGPPNVHPSTTKILMNSLES